MKNASASMKRRLLSLCICLTVLLGAVPHGLFGAASVSAATDTAVADIGTADSFESLMGTDVDGNRYAGRVWADKSVYVDGDTAILNTGNDAGSSFKVSLSDDEAFQIIFSVMGSSMSVKSPSGQIKEQSFNPIDNQPLIYVDRLGEYMEIKSIQAITLFGSSYTVRQHRDGTYLVSEATGINPTTNEEWNTTRDIRIAVSTDDDGRERLEIKINQQILPILLERVTANSDSAVIDEIRQTPLRVYYTVGIDSRYLLPSGDVDISEIDKDYAHINKADGKLTFFSNAFGDFEHTDKNGRVLQGDAHIGFQASADNRYYYHQKNQGIFTQVKAKDGSALQWNASEYGVLWDENAYDLTWMSYDEYLTAEDGDDVYTYVTYYRPTPSTTDAANAAEEVTYLVYTDWMYVKESIAFYDAACRKYINYNSNTAAYTQDDEGYVMSAEQIAAYVQKHPKADIYAVLGVGSARSSRLHNMTVEKETNATQTASLRYAPEYTYDTRELHNGNDVVVWLGNNGRLTTTAQTGIALTKKVTEPIGDAFTFFELTVTLPEGTVASPVVKDEEGNIAFYTYDDHVLTVDVAANHTVYITGIPAGTVCTVGENIRGEYHIDVESSTQTVTVPTIEEALNGKAYAAAVITNSPNKYGNLTIVKDISHQLTTIPEALSDKVFTFRVQLPEESAGKEFVLDTENASLITDDSITVGEDGSFIVTLKDNESVTVVDLPEGTPYTVTEINLPDGYTDITGAVSGTIIAQAEDTAHIINRYTVTPITPDVTLTGQNTVFDRHHTYAADEEFTVVLDAYDPITKTYTQLAADTAKQGERYRFVLGDHLKDVGIGTYYFRVRGQDGATPGMTYDISKGLFAVVVTDYDADGSLEYAVTCVTPYPDADGYVSVSETNDSYTLTRDFNHRFDTDKTYFDVQLQNLLHNDTGVDISLNTFHFEITSESGVLHTHTDSSGNAVIRLTDLSEGTYVYTVHEMEGEIGGMTYDGTVYTLTVTVEKDSDNRLVPSYTLTSTANSDTVTGDSTATLTFTNTYTLSAVDHTIQGGHIFQGKDLEDGMFAFELYTTDSSFDATSDTLVEITENRGNAFAFETITFDKIGTYYYSVQESIGDLGGVTYDRTRYHVTVTVSVDDTQTSALTAHVSVNKIGHNDDTSGDIVFVNRYTVSPVEYVFKGSTTLVGRALKTSEFTFTLTDGTILYGVTNRLNGTFTFPTLTYTTAGVYEYTFAQELPATADSTGFDAASGLQYDLTAYKVTVTVTDRGDGILTACADLVDTDGTQTPVTDAVHQLHYENRYIPSPVTVCFEGEKILADAELVDGAFTFDLYQTDHSFETDGRTPLASVANANGAFRFPAVSFDKTGTYFFVITENSDQPLDNIIYDGTRHRFSVLVTDIGEGQLKAAVTNMDTAAVTNGTAVHVTFTNTYTAPEDHPTTAATASTTVTTTAPTATSATPVPDNPKTGGDDLVCLWLAVLFVSGGVLVIGVLHGKLRKTT